MSTRSRFRRIAGPLSLLPDDVQLGGGEQVLSDQQLDDYRSSPGRETDATPEEPISPFQKGPWLSLCEAFGITAPFGGQAEPAIRETLGSTVSDVLEGQCGLRAHKLAGVATSVNHNGDGSVTVSIMDPSGSIHGYLHEGLIEEYGPDLVPGFAVALSKVSLLVSGPGVQRWLNITPMNIIGFFPKSLEADRTFHERWKEASHQQESQPLPGRSGTASQEAPQGFFSTGPSMQQRDEAEETRAFARLSDAPRLGKDEGRRGGGGESGMFGWGSDERRLEAISVLSSTATVTGGKGNQPSPPDQGGRTGMRKRGEERATGALDELVAMRRSSEKERPLARGSGREEEEEEEEEEEAEEAAEGRAAARRDMWSMDIDDDEDDDLLGMMGSHAGEGKPKGSAANALLDEAEAEWVIGDDRVLRPGSASGPSMSDRLVEEEQPRPGTRSGIQPILASRVVSRAEEELFSRPGTAGSTGAWREEEDAYPEFYGTEEHSHYHTEAPAYGDWEVEGGSAAREPSVLHDRTNVLGSYAADRWHDQGGGKGGGEGISRFGASSEADKPPSCAGVPAFSAEDDLLGGILEEDEMLW